MKFKIAAVSMIAALVIWGQLPAQLSAQGQTKHSAQLIEFDPPGTATTNSPACAPGCGTEALANNGVGEIVGFYTDANVVPHGFLRTPEGQIVSFDAPGAGLGAGLDEGTIPVAVNDQGVIVGELLDPSLLFHAFIRYPDGSFTTFQASGAGTGAFQGTEAFSIDPEGVVAGVYFDSSNVEHGFVRALDGTSTTIDPPGSAATMVCEETCINNAGVITGFYSDASSITHGFVGARDGKITVFDAPGAVAFTLGASINEEGTIAGYFNDGADHGFLRSSHGDFTVFDVPGVLAAGGLGTAAFSINTLGAVTGATLDAKVSLHGYERFADGTFATFDAPGAGTGFLQGTRPSTNNVKGEVAGWWTDASGLNHGFLWLPGEE